MLVVTLVMVMDGVSIGSSDFQHLPRTSLVATLGTWSLLTFAAMQGWCVFPSRLASTSTLPLPHLPPGTLNISYRFGTGRNRRGLGAVWWGMVTFFVMRLAQHGVHVVTHWDRHPLGTMRRAIRADTLLSV